MDGDGKSTHALNASPTLDPAFRSLARATALLKRVMDPYFASNGVTGSQAGILRTLYRSEEEGLSSLRLTDLGKRLIIRPPSVTSVVSRMQRMGLLTVSASAEDQRVKQVSLTPQGRRLFERLIIGHRQTVESILEPLSTDERRQLQHLLERVGRRLAELTDWTGPEGGMEPAPAAPND